LPDRAGRREDHHARQHEQHQAVRMLVSVAADGGYDENADGDADRDAPQHRPPAVLVRRRRRSRSRRTAGGFRHPGLHPDGYLLLDPVQEGCHHRVAVLGPQLFVGRRGGLDLGDHLAPGGGVRLPRARHPLARRGLDLVV